VKPLFRKETCAKEIKRHEKGDEKEGKKDENRLENGENNNRSYNTGRFCKRCKKSLFVANHKIPQISTNLFFKRKALPKEFFMKSRGFLH
jgi:hypothetical protein